MTATIRPYRENNPGFPGTVQVPASKSHTIRRLIIATLANGLTEIEQPLDSLDTRSCLSVCRGLGAEITEQPGLWTVRGIARKKTAQDDNCSPEVKHCDAGNSGTTLFFALAAAALGRTPVQFDGDEQLRKRDAGPLLEALSGLGASVKSAPGGCAPITVCGPWKGGRVSLPCPTSQYLSALLLAAPLAPAGLVTEIEVPLLNEKPYVEMTLSYLDSQEIPYKAARGFSYFCIPGGSAWTPFSGLVPGDFSSAANIASAAIISGESVTLLGLDPYDTQGDKVFFDFLSKMGCLVRWEENTIEQIPLGQSIDTGLLAIGQKPLELKTTEWRLTVARRGRLRGGKFDLNNTPDLLPVMAALACFARGDTALLNAASARLKESDRIKTMAEELGKLGVKCTEHPDGLVIHGTGEIPVTGKDIIKTDSRGDHRIAMALACIAPGCPVPMEISGAESVGVSYPGFLELLGAEL